MSNLVWTVKCTAVWEPILSREGVCTSNG
jgi:hypothetical protein